MLSLPAWLYISLSSALIILHGVVFAVRFTSNDALISLCMVILCATFVALALALCVGKGHGSLRMVVAGGLFFLVLMWIHGWYTVMHSTEAFPELQNRAVSRGFLLQV